MKTKRFKIKRVRGTYVLHVKKSVRGRKAWRRLWGWTFPVESVARQFAEGNF